MSSMQFYEWLSEPSVKEKLKGEVYKKERAEGKTHAEAREEADAAGKASGEFLDKEDVKEDYQKLKQAQLKQQQANKTISVLENENPNLKVAHDNQRPIATQESSTVIKTSELLKLLEYTRAREAQNSASREAFSIASDIREKADAFARAHPTFAKWGRYALKGIGAAAMTTTLITAAQVGLGSVSGCWDIYTGYRSSYSGCY